MIAEKIQFRGSRCFKEHFVGFDDIKPINLIIGRNNTGKSHLLDLVPVLCGGVTGAKGWTYQCSGKLTEDELRRIFREDTSGGELGGNHWNQHGRLFVDQNVEWEIDKGNVTRIKFDDGFDNESPYGGTQSTNARMARFHNLLKDPSHQLNGRRFRRILADRDIRSEPMNTTLILESDGTGATNIVRRYLTTASNRYPREIIQVDVLEALNRIFGQDGKFTEIDVRLHDDGNSDGRQNDWEVYLGEPKKGMVALSKSGSGLKTVILVLLNLLVIPTMEGHARDQYVFAFEELENNLHPALLRRLFTFIEIYAVKEKTPVFITTHSSAALDVFSLSTQSQIIHVTHDGEFARATTVAAHFDRLGVISELGAKPSDLLQANGIIWVEGPSDCIYMNRWIDLYSQGKFQEGRDYQCAFYGGSLLARTQFTSPEEAEKDLINLFRVNPNIAVMCDGDRAARGARVKDRVRRIRSEVQKIPNAHIWVTGAREVENYLPGSAIANSLELSSLPDPGLYESFFPRKGAPGQSFLEKKIKRKTLDKMDLAVAAVGHLDLASMKGRFDWDSQMKKLVDRIEAWNK